MAHNPLDPLSGEEDYENASVGGHRVGAMKAIGAAIRQLKLAQQYDK